jgi:hypothetical protein
VRDASGRPSSRLRIIVSGLVGQYPLGGVAWDYIQYPVGLQRMGHDVYYLEDTGQWPYSPVEVGVSSGHDFTVRHLSDVMQRFGLQDRWMYRFPWGPRWFGLSDRRREEVVATADLLINVSGTLRAPDEYRGRARLVYVDTDPVFTQVKLARGQADFRKMVDAHDVHFSFGELIAAGRARDVPDVGIRWLPTRQPVVIDEWTGLDATPRDTWTTIMNWTSYKPVVHDGRTYGQKDLEMQRFMTLPGLVDVPLELAVSPGKTRRTPHGLLRRHGWRVVDPNAVCPDVERYRDYVATSAGEWSVAKHGYVAGWSGWFSCRTACYLAAGRPAVVQDTGFSEVLPTGEGLLAFTTIEGAADAIRSVTGDHARHARAARGIASEHFDSRNVLQAVIDASPAVGQAPVPAIVGDSARASGVG